MGRSPTEERRAARTALGSNFWRLWTATAAADLADGVLKVSLPLVAATLTSSPVLVASA